MANEYEKLSKKLGVDPLGAGKLEDKIGFCLSGGGFKAAIFHLGALERLNELGLLGRISRFSSVSGGSITSAWLGLNWYQLEASFDPDGVATAFDPVIKQPLIKFALQAEIDVGSVVGGLLNPFGTAAEKLADCYDKYLFKGKTLQDLPLDKARNGKQVGPRFVINVSSLQHNSLWRLSRRYIANYEVGLFPNPKIKLSDAVAASSAFPPVLSPAKLNLKGLKVKKGTEGPLFKPPYNTRPEVADGGIYDNLGLETVWKRCKTILVSNAGNPFEVKSNPPNDWMSQLRRVVSMMHRNEENHRLRWLISMGLSGDRDVALWSLRGRHTDFGLSDSIGLTEADANRVGKQDVRLKPLKRAEALKLVRHGYSVSDASLRRFIEPGAAPPQGLPGL